MNGGLHFDFFAVLFQGQIQCGAPVVAGSTLCQEVVELIAVIISL
jgi:hypothetical protein